MSTFSAPLRSHLRAAGLDVDDVRWVVDRALAEDLAWGPDVTTEATVPAGAVVTGTVTARAAGVVAGVPVARAVLEAVATDAFSVDEPRPDGSRVDAGDAVAVITGPWRSLLTAERSMLNLLTHLSGIATTTRAWVDAVAGTAAVIRDTRKTTPGLRLLDKYAVRCGGGTNHRLGLGDAVLIKDNHVVASGGLTQAIENVRRLARGLPLEVECDTVDQVREAIDAGVALVLLDNMDSRQMREAVALARAKGGVHVEASGGLTLERAREVAEAGVDFLAVGALTHSAPALDLGLDL